MLYTRLWRETLRRITSCAGGSNTAIVPLQVVRGAEKGTQCLAEILGHPVSGG
jgi:hypothetical protein